MKVATIIGARPQFIKSAPVSAAFQKVGIKELTIHTGQHYDSNMSAVFFDEMNLPQPNYRLNCGGIGHSEMIGNMLLQLTPILKDESPDYVLVYGDTNSTLAGALAANKLQIPLIHVEAGLRSYNLEMPEEMNRILTDRMSSILFTPSSKAVKNLEREGFKNYECKILDIGDVMFDALLQFQSSAHWIPDMGAEEFFDNDFGLVTLHRFENINDRQRLAQLVQELNDVHKDCLPLWMPLHPATSNKLEEFDLELNIYTAPPVGYLQMLWLL
jgi:UDP-GlcNAc3NAcA epimerase